MDDEQLRRVLEGDLSRLERLHLATRTPLFGEWGGLLPGPDSDWIMVRDGDSMFWVQDAVLEHAGEGTLEQFLELLGQEQDQKVRKLAWLRELDDEASVFEDFGRVLEREGSRAAFLKEIKSPTSMRGIVILVLFLPQIVVMLALRMPSHPGSAYTLGEVLLGFSAAAALVGAVVALFTGHWLLLASLVYWRLGASVLAREDRRLGTLRGSA